MIWDCMAFKRWEVAIIISTINTHVYTEILDNFFILMIENRFSDDNKKQPLQIEDTLVKSRGQNRGLV